jgi:hypothetical protein
VASLFYRNGSGLSNIKILITLPYGEGCVRSQEFMVEDLGEEDMVGDVLGFEHGRSGGGPSFQGRSREPKAKTYFGSSRAGGGVDGLRGRKAL